MSTRAQTRQKSTPPQVAQLWGVSPEKVIEWIKAGELRAINAATRCGGRPRYLIDLHDLEAFELRRSAAPVANTRRRRRSEPGVIEYF